MSHADRKPSAEAIAFANWMSRHIVGERMAAEDESCPGCAAKAQEVIDAAERRGEERMRERAALVLEAEATCDCQGKAGRCLINDPPREFATIIRALPLTPEPGQ